MKTGQKKGWMTGVLLLGLLLSANFGFAAPFSVQVTKDDGGLKVLHAESIIDAPVNIVWENLTDYASIKNYLPGYNKSTILQDAGNRKTVDIGFKPAAITPNFHYQVAVQEQPGTRSISIQRISGDFKAITANYKLIPLDNGNKTRLVYNLQVDMGGLPTLGASQILKSNTEKGMQAMQAYCNKAYKRSLAASADR